MPKVIVMRVGALSLWLLAAVLAVSAMLSDAWKVGDAAIGAAIAALAVDLRRYTITAVQSVVRAVSLYHDDVPPR